MSPADFNIAALALCAFQQAAGGGQAAAAAIAHAIVNRSAIDGGILTDTIEIFNRTGLADPLLLPDARNPAWIAHLRNVDAIYFGSDHDPTNGGAAWADMSVPSPAIPEGLEHCARVGKLSFFK